MHEPYDAWEPEEPPPGPYERNPDIARFVESVVKRRVQDKGLWPQNLVQLELEQAGVYQDFSGSVIRELLSTGEMSKGEKGTQGQRYPYLCEEDRLLQSDMADALHEKVVGVHAAIRSHSMGSYFAELINHCALQHVIHDLRSNGLRAVDLLPKDQYPRWLGYTGEVDALLQIRGEYLPIDVYNGTHYQMVTDGKPQTAREIYGHDRAYPCLINRLSSRDVKHLYLRLNGLVLDHGEIIISSQAKEDIEDHLNDLQIRDAIRFVENPTVDDHLLEGELFDDLVNQETGGVPVLSRAGFAQAGSELPEELLSRTRGFIFLLIVNTDYRHADNRFDETRSLILQEAYNELLRLEEPLPMDELLDDAWKAFRTAYPNLKNSAAKNQDELLDETRQRLGELSDLGLLNTRKGKGWAKYARHPFKTLEF